MYIYIYIYIYKLFKKEWAVHNEKQLASQGIYSNKQNRVCYSNKQIENYVMGLRNRA